MILFSYFVIHYILLRQQIGCVLFQWFIEVVLTKFITLLSCTMDMKYENSK